MQSNNQNVNTNNYINKTSPGAQRTFGKNKLITSSGINKGRSPALSSKIDIIKEEKETPPKI